MDVYSVLRVASVTAVSVNEFGAECPVDAVDTAHVSEIDPIETVAVSVTPFIAEDVMCNLILLPGFTVCDEAKLDHVLPPSVDTETAAV